MVLFLFAFALAAYFLAKYLYGKEAAIMSVALIVGFTPFYGNGKAVLGGVGQAWRGAARLGMASRAVAGTDASPCGVRPGAAGEARHGTVCRVLARRGRRGMALHGWSWHG
jgi:hypothetical protein